MGSQHYWTLNRIEPAWLRIDCHRLSFQCSQVRPSSINLDLFTTVTDSLSIWERDRLLADLGPSWTPNRVGLKWLGIDTAVCPLSLRSDRRCRRRERMSSWFGLQKETEWLSSRTAVENPRSVFAYYHVDIVGQCRVGYTLQMEVKAQRGIASRSPPRQRLSITLRHDKGTLHVMSPWTYAIGDCDWCVTPRHTQNANGRTYHCSAAVMRTGANITQYLAHTTLNGVISIGKWLALWVTIPVTLSTENIYFFIGHGFKNMARI